jgi:predicted DNA-binding transcriptional regulator AlpA
MPSPQICFRVLTADGKNPSVSAVTDAHGSDALPPGLAKVLRQAFIDHGEAAGHRWEAEIEAVKRRPRHLPDADWVVRIHLARADIAPLLALLRSATGDPAASSALMGTKQVAAAAHVTESTVRSWKATRGPKGHPFPKPTMVYGRCQWERSAVDAWILEEKRRREK